MKKIIIFVLATIFLTTAFISPISAAENNETLIYEETEYFSDGSSVVIRVTEETSILTRATSTKSGTKSYTARNSDGDVQWTFTVKGTFSVNIGTSATCTAASYSTSNIASGWSLDSASTKKSSNKAIGDATFKHKVLFVTTQTKDITVTLICDANGNLS